MASVKFYDFKFAGRGIRSERSLDKIVKWIGHNKCRLEVGCYQIEYDGMLLCDVILDPDGRVYFN